MAEATCRTCPFASPGDAPDAAGRPRVLCHHATVTVGEAEPLRLEEWWCSEHPGRQRDRLAAGFARAIVAKFREAADAAGAAPAIAEDAYILADAMLAERERPGGA